MIKKISFLLTVSILVLSCSKDKDMTTEEVSLTQTELNAIFTTDDIAGVADTALGELFSRNTMTGKTEKSNDCYSAEYTDTGFTATFNNCILSGMENVRGTVSVVYDVNSESGSFTATYTDFYVGNIKINGTRSISIEGNTEENSFSLNATSSMTIILEHGTEISENGSKTFSFNLGDDLETSTYTIEGIWSLKVDENRYQISVTEPLAGNLSCSYLTSGNMSIAKNGLLIDVAMGDGTCDNIATVIYPNGTTEEIELEK